jgi:hypothetical protein
MKATPALLSFVKSATAGRRLKSTRGRQGAPKVPSRSDERRIMPALLEEATRRSRCASPFRWASCPRRYPERELVGMANFGAVVAHDKVNMGQRDVETVPIEIADGGDQSSRRRRGHAPLV